MRASILLTNFLVLGACIGDPGDPLEADNLGEADPAAVTCGPHVSVFPVRGKHNLGFDQTAGNAALWTCDSAHANSDFVPGSHLGNDIWAAHGTPVAATVDGTLRYVAHTAYSGNKLTIVDACGYYHFYAHLNGFGPGISPATANGKHVHAGQIVGYVGNTGTASNGVIHLHYSIYPNDNYNAGINPYPYLHAAEHDTCGKRRRVAADFNGDGKADIALWRPSNGNWYIHGTPGIPYGKAGDIPVPADYDGDGVTERAVFRPANGTWYVDGQAIPYGQAGDIPVPADYDGDGKAELAVFRPQTGEWFVRGAATVHYGEAGDIPVPGDYAGAGHAQRAVWRPSSGTWYVEGTHVQYGAAGDIPVPGDYDGDGKLERALFRPSTGVWYIEGVGAVTYGKPGDIPNPADYDGDGKAERAVFRPSTGEWFVWGGTVIEYGEAGDIPLR